jgi:sugar/nucleoside kinase (ribokinase family)
VSRKTSASPARQGPRIVVLGNLLVDDLVFADGRTRIGQAGGAVLYAALSARLGGAQVGCVSVAGTDYPQSTLDTLTSLGIDLTGVRRLDAPGVRTWLLYEDGARQLVHRLGCPTHQDVSPGPADIPLAWQTARAFHLAPMPFGAQRTLVTALASETSRFVSVDPHLPVTEETLPRWRRVLADADAFFPSEDEMLLGGSNTDVRALLPRLVCGRLRFVVLTRGAKGGLLYDARERRFHEWSARVDRVVDPTGAGDAFAAGFVVGHLDGLPVEACLRRGHVAASYALESWGAAALIAATPRQVARRLRQWSPDHTS